MNSQGMKRFTVSTGNQLGPLKTPAAFAFAENRKRRLPVASLVAFAAQDGLPQTDDELKAALHSDLVQQIYCCALGPEGTNIGQACQQWIHRMAISGKSSIKYCETPEKSVEMSRTVSRNENIGFFWTCAVYIKEHELFFRNPDSLPFYTQQVMPLDEMQLAVRTDLAEVITSGCIPKHWRILSHPSPAPLLYNIEDQVILANSNSDAAERCAKGEAECCITTESAREIYKLSKLHSFGSPNMVFFGGITPEGAALLRLINAHRAANFRTAVRTLEAIK